MKFDLRKSLGAETEAEAIEFEELAAQIAFDAPLQQPRASLKDRVMAATTKVNVLRASESEWKPTPFEGVTYKSLFVDTETKMRTVILKLAAGASYPRHRHARVEQCLVLSGDVEMEGVVKLGAGDFEWIEGGTTHEGVRSRGGCELLIISSMEDEILA
jgi:anti-sigma factor ChrR (cupin superfamily)